MLQESYLIKFGMAFKKEQNLNLKYTIKTVKFKLPPLEQGGVEIPVKVLFARDSCDKVSILVEKIKVVEYLITESILFLE